MTSRVARVVLLVSTVAAAGLVVATPAGAAPVFVSCGQTITVDTTLAGPVSNCANDGIIIGANRITLDLNGFAVSGTPNPGDGAGVLVIGRTSVVVKNGTVRGFDGGVVIQAGTNNVVTNIVAEDNVGQSLGHPPAPGTKYGDGIAILGSSNNIIRFNTARRNAPYSGIGIYERSDTDHPSFTTAPARNNLVEGNNVLDNTGCRLGGTCDNDGIRVEPFVGPGNRIQNNLVAGNGLDGISLFGGVNGTVVTGNQLYRNGFFGSANGDGIRVFGFANFISNNTAVGNRGAGLSVARRTGAAIGSLAAPNGRDNQLLGNNATGNVVFDLWDSNASCDNNTWHGNRYRTANQPCTTVGGFQV